MEIKKLRKRINNMDKKVLLGTLFLVVLISGLFMSNHVLKNYDIDLKNDIIINGDILKSKESYIDLNGKGMDITGFDYKAYEGEIFEVKFNVSNNLSKHFVKPTLQYYVEDEKVYEESFGYVEPGAVEEVKAYLKMPVTSKENVEMFIKVREDIHDEKNRLIGTKDIIYELEVKNLGETWSPNKVVPTMSSLGLEDLQKLIPKLPTTGGSLENILGGNIVYLIIGLVVIFGGMGIFFVSNKKKNEKRMLYDTDYQLSKTPTYKLDNWATQKMIDNDARQKMLMMKALDEATDRDAKGQGNTKMIVMLILVLGMMVALFVFILPKLGVV